MKFETSEGLGTLPRKHRVVPKELKMKNDV
jgi:hypothetical protein